MQCLNNPLKKKNTAQEILTFSLCQPYQTITKLGGEAFSFISKGKSPETPIISAVNWMPLPIEDLKEITHPKPGPRQRPLCATMEHYGDYLGLGKNWTQNRL